MILWFVSIGWADSVCTTSLDELLDDVGRVENGLRTDDPEAASGAALRLRTKLPCLQERIPAIVVPRLFRAIGGGLLVQRHPESLGWLRSAAAVDPGFRYTVDLVPEESPLIAAWDEAVDGMRGSRAEPMPLRVFGPGVHWLDGRSLTAPVAVPGVPHVYQYQENAQANPATELVWGNDFPDAYVQLQGVSTAPSVVLDKSDAIAPPSVTGPELIGHRSGKGARAGVVAAGNHPARRLRGARRPVHRAPRERPTYCRSSGRGSRRLGSGWPADLGPRGVVHQGGQ